jgi:hypothetical protein
MLRMYVYMHSRFVENHPIQILEDGPLISEVVLSQFTMDFLLTLTTGVASGHFVNLSMAMYRYWYPPMALGNGPKMSSPHTVNNHEGGIICSIYASV